MIMKDKNKIIQDFAEMLIEDLRPQIIRMVANHFKSETKKTGFEDMLSGVIGGYSEWGVTLSQVCQELPELTGYQISKTLSSLGYNSVTVRRGDKVLRVYKFSLL